MKNLKPNLFKKFLKSELAGIASIYGGIESPTKINQTWDKSRKGQTEDDIYDTSTSRDRVGN